jgi:hypothetical protein
MFLTTYEQVLHGDRLTATTVKPSRSSMWFFYDFPPGTGRSSGTHLMQFTPPGISSLAHNRSRLRAGTRFGRLVSDYDRPGFEVLAGEQGLLTPQAIAAAESAHRAAFLEPVPE